MYTLAIEILDKSRWRFSASRSKRPVYQLPKNVESLTKLAESLLIFDRKEQINGLIFRELLETTI